MSWRTAAAVMLTVTILILVSIIMVDPLAQIQSEFNETGDYDNQYYNGNDLLGSWTNDWVRMTLVAIFGMLLYGAARVVRRELTRRQR